MSGSPIGSAECATDSGNFFERTENNYRNMETRARALTERLEVFCDGINGGQPREAYKDSGGADRHPAAFDRCNTAESNMYGAMSGLEESLCRLEQIGLT